MLFFVSSCNNPEINLSKLPSHTIITQQDNIGMLKQSS